MAASVDGWTEEICDVRKVLITTASGKLIRCVDIQWATTHTMFDLNFYMQSRTRPQVREAATQPDFAHPELVLSLDVNALNCCRSSLLPLSNGDEAYVGVPNLVESSFVCLSCVFIYCIDAHALSDRRMCGLSQPEAVRMQL